MQKLLVFALASSVAALTGGCGTLDPFAGDEVAEAPAPPPQPTDWMLVRPPDNAAARHMVDVVAYLPDGDDAFPRSASNGVDAEQRGESLLLFRQIQRQASPRAQANVLVEEFVVEDAPMAEWQHVRRFRSREHCERTRQELEDVTREESSKVTYEPGMLIKDMQFVWLASSFASSYCVREDSLPSARAG